MAKYRKKIKVNIQWKSSKGKGAFSLGAWLVANRSNDWIRILKTNLKIRGPS